MVAEPIQTRGSQQRVYEDIGPLRRGAIAGQDDAAFLVAAVTALFIMRGSFLVTENALNNRGAVWLYE